MLQSPVSIAALGTSWHMAAFAIRPNRFEGAGRGFTTDYIHDADAGRDLDRIEHPEVPLPGGASERPATLLEHNARGQLTESTDPAGRVSFLAYDATSTELWSSTADPDGLALTTSYGYDALGNRTAETDPKGNTTRLTFDAARALIRMSNAEDFASYARLADDLIEPANKDQLVDAARLPALNIGCYRERYGDVPQETLLKMVQAETLDEETKRRLLQQQRSLRDRRGVSA